jgi:hypothetical protein
VRGLCLIANAVAVAVQGGVRRHGDTFALSIRKEHWLSSAERCMPGEGGVLNPVPGWKCPDTTR